MSYYLHITRNTNMSFEDEDEKNNISFEEWLNYLKSDPELNTPTDWEAREGYCEWTAYPAEFKPTFDYSRGTPYPQQKTSPGGNSGNRKTSVNPLIAIAQHLYRKRTRSYTGVI